MTNQRKKEIYEYVLERLEYYLKESIFGFGICAIIHNYNNYDYSKNEYLEMEKVFKSKRPGIFSKFFWNKAYHQNILEAYWWTRDEKGMQQRIKFIKHIISKL